MEAININEPAKLSKALKNGQPFYLCDKDSKMVVLDPELEKAKAKLTALLQEAEDCKEYITLDECKARLARV